MTRSFNPSRRQNRAHTRTHRVGTTAKEVEVAGGRLLEKPLLFERLAEDHAEHPAMPRVGHRFHTRPPAFDELLRLAGMALGETAPRIPRLLDACRGRRRRV